MTSQTCHSQYIKHVIEHIQCNSQIILNTILTIIRTLFSEDQLDTHFLESRLTTAVTNRVNIVRCSPRDLIKDITHLHNFSRRCTGNLKIVELCNIYPFFESTFPNWFDYKSRKQSRVNIERYGIQMIKQLYFLKHLGKYIFVLIAFRQTINNYMGLSELDQKIDQSKRTNKEHSIRKIVSDINYFYNVINQEYQKYIKNLIPPINPSKSRSDMMKMESFFKDLGHLKQTSRKIKDLVTDNYSIVDNIGSSLAKFIQSPQQQKGDHEMVCRLVNLLSINIAKQT